MFFGLNPSKTVGMQRVKVLYSQQNSRITETITELIYGSGWRLKKLKCL